MLWLVVVVGFPECWSGWFEWAMPDVVWVSTLCGRVGVLVAPLVAVLLDAVVAEL